MSDRLKYLRELTEKLISCNECPKNFSVDWSPANIKKVLKSVDSNTSLKHQLKTIAGELCKKEVSHLEEDSDGN
jgi:hypothetical protein